MTVCLQDNPICRYLDHGRAGGESVWRLIGLNQRQDHKLDVSIKGVMCSRHAAHLPFSQMIQSMYTLNEAWLEIAYYICSLLSNTLLMANGINKDTPRLKRTPQPPLPRLGEGGQTE